MIVYQGGIMDNLIRRLKNESEYLGGGIIKADSIINHQLDPELTREMGNEFEKLFTASGVKEITRILTAEVSGIAPALAAASSFNVPMVFARKKTPKTMKEELFTADAPSRTKDENVTLHVSSKYLKPGDRVIIIDDFLATGHTIEALASIVKKSGAILCGVGCVIEKVFEKGRKRLDSLGIPVITLAKIDVSEKDEITIY